jgi:REP element-mobilizing transposase RayT
MNARQLLPGSTYFITRRCTQRQFWLRPSEETNRIFAYCVAAAAARYEIQVHAICVLSNHWHAAVTDPHSQLPKFLHWVHLYVAKCINVLHGRWENMWSSEETSVVRLERDEDVLDKIVYCLANPVAAGLVAHGEQWPGLRTAPRELAGAEVEVARPAVFFREEGPTEKTCVLRIVRPPILPGLSDVKLAERVAELVEAREAGIRDEHGRGKRRFLGIKAVLRQLAFDRPKTKEPRRKLSPRVAAKDKQVRIAALQRLKSFLKGYREALRAWCQGWRDVEFPPGTYAMRVLHGVVCASP